MKKWDKKLSGKSVIMKIQNVYIILLLVPTMHYASECETEAQYFDKQKKIFLAQYHPSPERCRAAIKERDNKRIIDDQSFTLSLKGGIACMLAGFRNVYLGESPEEIDEYESLDRYTKALLDAHDIREFKIDTNLGGVIVHEFVLYTRKAN